MRVNRDIRAPRVRVITEDGEMLGVFAIYDALAKSQEMGLDLVEIAPTANPPVCKIIDYGKFRYQQTKREKLNKKASHQTKNKEIKVKPNIASHDLEVKIKHAREFLEEGCKVKVSCMFRGRELAFIAIGEQVMAKVWESLKDTATQESPAKMFGKSLTMTLAPSAKEKKQKEKEKEKKSAEVEDQ